MILTTTDTVEGFRIIEYKGIITGTSSRLKTSFSFKTEKNMSIIGDVMNDAKELAFQELKANALGLKANAVVGINVDIETASGSYFFVSVTGTAVTVA